MRESTSQLPAGLGVEGTGLALAEVAGRLVELIEGGVPLAEDAGRLPTLQLDELVGAAESLPPLDQLDHDGDEHLGHAAVGDHHYLTLGLVVPVVEELHRLLDRRDVDPFGGLDGVVGEHHHAGRVVGELPTNVREDAERGATIQTKEHLHWNLRVSEATGLVT